MLTTFQLSEAPAIKYSQREKLVFDAILSKGSRTTTREIAEKVFPDNKVFHVKATVNSALSSLKKKLDYNKEPFKIKISGHAGPNPMEVWLEHRG